MGKLIEDLHTKNLIYLIINKILKAEKQCLTTQLNPTIHILSSIVKEKNV
jgi:hypothetical protein